MPLKNKEKNKNFSCWIVTEGIAGTENQCLGVAQALGLSPDIIKIKLRQPWKSLSPLLRFENALTFKTKLEPPWPDLLLTSGRKSIAAARYIKKASKGKTVSVHIQNPKTSHANFDLIAAPLHDQISGKNVLSTRGAPNKITPENLEKAKQTFRGFEDMPPPRIAVLIGGSSKAYTMSPAITRALCDKLKTLDGGLMITASRRTGSENMAILQEALQGTNSYIWDGHGDNPYLGMLAWADVIMVTADSVSMLSDAATTGKPVYIIPLEEKPKSKRIEIFHKTLIDEGIARVFEGEIKHWNYTPLNDAEFIATEIRRLLSAQG